MSFFSFCLFTSPHLLIRFLLYLFYLTPAYQNDRHHMKINVFLFCAHTGGRFYAVLTQSSKTTYLINKTILFFCFAHCAADL